MQMRLSQRRAIPLVWQKQGLILVQVHHDGRGALSSQELPISPSGEPSDNPGGTRFIRPRSFAFLSAFPHCLVYQRRQHNIRHNRPTLLFINMIYYECTLGKYCCIRP
jgi:hypothetical protein